MRKILLLIVWLTGFVQAFAQDGAGNDEPVDFDADRYSFRRIDSLNQLQMMAGNVVIRQGTTTFYADSAVYNRYTKIVEAFGNVRINDNDSVNIYSDYLHYRTDNKFATLKRNIRLTDGQSTLYTNELTYDVNESIGTYLTGGRLENKGSVLTSKEAVYYGELKDVYFKKNVELTDPGFNLKTEELLYNTETEIVTFTTFTEIKDSTRRIETTAGYYDMRNKVSHLGNRPVIYDGSVIITAQNIYSNDTTGISRLEGNAVYKDTAEGIALLANFIESNSNDKSFFATQNPLLIIKQKEDSLYISADTMRSGKLSILYKERDSLAALDENGEHGNDGIMINSVEVMEHLSDSADRYFMAWYNVRIFSDSLQGRSDSLFYSGIDSVFRMYYDPVLWASGSQITGDTIYLYTKNKEADRLYVAENAIIINETGEGMFNQIRGNRINGFFVEGNIDYMRAQGNSESLYYVRDDQEKIIGVNKAESDIIDIRFKEKEINQVVFISEVRGTTYPPSRVPEDEKKLRNFNWRESERPKTKEELFEKDGKNKIKTEEIMASEGKDAIDEGDPSED